MDPGMSQASTDRSRPNDIHPAADVVRLLSADPARRSPWLGGADGGALEMMGGVSVNQAAEIGRVDQELAAAMGARLRDAAACISALEKAIALARSDSAAADVFYLPELLDELAELYDQVGRVDDALAAMRQALDEGWRGQPDGRCRLAEVLMRGGRVAEAGPIWAQVRADTPGDVWVINSAGLEYGAITSRRWRG